MRDLRALPKVELHIHLEGSTRIDTVRELADRNGVSVPTALSPSGWRFEGPAHFIAQYVQLCSLLTELEDFRRVGREVCEDLAAEGVPYAEAVFSPSNHASRLGDDWYGPIEAMLDGLAAGERDTGVRVRLCPDIVRDLGTEAAERTLEVALAYADNGVIALNAAGSERASVERFAPMFRRARSAGLRSVPHAGEWAGPQSIWDTLEHYEPDRIGHGVRAIDDPHLVDELAARAIPLEVAPVSNVGTGAVSSLGGHPLPALRAAGVVVTLNSDDPPMFGAWPTAVYEAARQTWGFDDATLAALAAASVRASFADEERKLGMLVAIDRWLAEEPAQVPTP